MDPKPADSQLTARHWGLLTLLFTSFMFPYVDRVNIAVAGPVLMKQIHLSPVLFGTVLSAFTFAYLIGLIVAGPLADTFGTKICNTVGGFLWAAGTLVNGWVGSFGSLLITRLVVGLGEGPLTPVADRIVAHEFPKERRATGVSIYFSGNKFGLTLGVPIAALAIHAWGWPAAFFVTGGLSLLWLIAWMLFYREPAAVAAGRRQPKQAPAPVNRMTFWQLFRHRAVWGLLLGQAGYFYSYTVFITWLPSYLVIARHMSLLKTGFIGSLPFLLGVITTILSGVMGDTLVKRGWSRTVARKSFVVGGLIVTAASTMMVPAVQSTLLAVVFLMIAVGAIGLSSGQINVLPVDIAPGHLVGSLGGIQAFGGNLGALIAPVLTGALLQATHTFTAPLLVSALFALFGAANIIFMVGKAEPQFPEPTTVEASQLPTQA